jgi:hypothetical protein
VIEDPVVRREMVDELRDRAIEVVLKDSQDRCYDERSEEPKCRQ